MKFWISVLFVLMLGGCATAKVADHMVSGWLKPLAVAPAPTVERTACPVKKVTHSCYNSSDPMHKNYQGKYWIGKLFPPSIKGMSEAQKDLLYSRIFIYGQCRDDIVQSTWDAHDNCVEDLEDD